MSHPSYHHPHHHHHHHAPVDTPIVLPPEPPTSTPAEPSEADVERCVDASSSSSSNRAHILPSLTTDDDRWLQEDDDDQTRALHDHHDRDRDADMLDPIPIDSSSTARTGLASLDIISQRIPTPRYGTFFPSTSTATASSPPTTDRVEASIVRAMGLSSLNRILPSPIHEGDGTAIIPHQIFPMDRHHLVDDDDDDDDVSMTLGSSPPPFLRLDPTPTTKLWPPESARTRSMAAARTGKPMLVMGYRADCDKCRARVPGHYSHIVRSS